MPSTVSSQFHGQRRSWYQSDIRLRADLKKKEFFKYSLDSNCYTWGIIRKRGKWGETASRLIVAAAVSTGN